MDCSLSGSSVHGVFQARVLEWIAIPFSRVSSQPRNRTQVSRIAGRRFTVWATMEFHYNVSMHKFCSDLFQMELIGLLESMISLIAFYFKKLSAIILKNIISFIGLSPSLSGALMRWMWNDLTVHALTSLSLSPSLGLSGCFFGIIYSYITPSLLIPPPFQCCLIRYYIYPLNY